MNRPKGMAGRNNAGGTLAYLKSGVVVRIAPEGWDPKRLDYDETRDGAGASIGATWDGSQFVRKPLPAATENRFSLEEEADAISQGMRNFLALPNPTNPQRLAFERLAARAVVVVLRLLRNQTEGTN